MLKIFYKRVFCLTIGSAWFGNFLRAVCGDDVNVRMYRSNAKIQLSGVGRVVAGDVYSRLVFNSYERHERSLFREFFLGSELIVELGASIGVMTAEVLTAFPESKLVVVEGNLSALPTLRHVIVQSSAGQRVILVEKYFVPAGMQHSFEAGGNTLNNSLRQSVASQPSKGGDQAVAVTPSDLGDLVRDHATGNLWSLVCDIEGFEFLLTDEAFADAMNECREICIELHETNLPGLHFTIDNHIDRLSALGFSLVASSARAHYFRRE